MVEPVESGKLILKKYGGIAALPVSQNVISKPIDKDWSRVSIFEFLINTFEESAAHNRESDHVIS
jgi:hypothetical protein